MEVIYQSTDFICLYIICGGFLSIVIACLISCKAGWKLGRFVGLVLGVFTAGFIIALLHFRTSCIEAFRAQNPFGPQLIVVYRLKDYYFSNPGGGSDGPAVAKIFDDSGHQIGHLNIPAMQMAKVTWAKDGVFVGSQFAELPFYHAN